MPRKPGSELLRGCGLYLLCVSGGRLPGELDPASRCCFPWTESPGPRAETRDHRDAQKCASDLQRYRAAYRNRTDDLRITGGPLPGRARASCTDGTDHRTDGTVRAGIIRRPGPRTGPRPGPCVPASCYCTQTLLMTWIRARKRTRRQGPKADLHAATPNSPVSRRPDLHDMRVIFIRILTG